MTGSVPKTLPVGRDGPPDPPGGPEVVQRPCRLAGGVGRHSLRVGRGREILLMERLGRKALQEGQERS